MSIYILGPDQDGNCCTCAERVNVCDTCGGGTCRSKSGTYQLISCDSSEVLFYHFNEDVSSGGAVVNVQYTLTASSNGDGTWTVTFNFLSATCISGCSGFIPWIIDFLCFCGITTIPGPDVVCANGVNGGIRVLDGGKFLINDCVFPPQGNACAAPFLSNPVLYHNSGGLVNLGPNAGIIPGGWLDYGQQTALAASYFFNNSYPYDSPSNCTIAYCSNIDYGSGTFQFNYNQQKLTLTGLTIDQTYCLTVNFESRAYGSSDSWTPFSAIHILFTAESETEVTDWLDAFNGGASPSMNGLEVRFKNYTITIDLSDCIS